MSDQIVSRLGWSGIANDEIVRLCWGLRATAIRNAITGQGDAFMPIPADFEQADQPLDVDASQIGREHADGMQDVERIQKQRHRDEQAGDNKEQANQHGR